MEIFLCERTDGESVFLNADESSHCVRVLRHRSGDDINVIDGTGNMYECRITDDSPKGVVAQIRDTHRDWGARGYSLTMAVCPTKNTDRYEWFAEKATELGVDVIVPVIGKHSERKEYKTGRLEKLTLSAAKQSLKAKLPAVEPVVSVSDFIRRYDAEGDVLKLIAYCFEGEQRRLSIVERLAEYSGSSVVVMIGPEGDFSADEVSAALLAGFVPVHIGESRLRTETAAVAAATAVYFRYL